MINASTTGIPFPAMPKSCSKFHAVAKRPSSVTEGPFGDGPGYYASNSRPEPVLQVKAIYHRNDPIIVGAHR